MPLTDHRRVVILLLQQRGDGGSTVFDQIITQGRTTAGPTQANDTGYWKDLVWLKQDEYESMSIKE